jgi:hypothetical protein
MNKLLFKVFVSKLKVMNKVRLLFVLLGNEKSRMLVKSVLNKFNILFLIIPLLILNSCDTTSKTTEKEIPKEISSNPIILFCPQDNCEKNLIALINFSKQSIHCAFYDLRLKNVINTLASKSHDVDVKIVMEKNNYNGQIKGNIRLDNNTKLMHNKFCIIDKNIVWTGSFNPTIKALHYNNNNVIVLYSSYLAENYEDEFNDLWSGNFSSGNTLRHPITHLKYKKI